MHSQISNMIEPEARIRDRIQHIYSLRLLADKYEQKQKWKREFDVLMELAFRYGIYDIDQLESVMYFCDTPIIVGPLNESSDQNQNLKLEVTSKLEFIQALTMYFVSEDGADFDRDEFIRKMMLAHNLHHKAALGLKGHLMYYYNLDMGLDTFVEEEHILQAARNGCIGSYISAGEILRHRQEYQESALFIKLATMYGYSDQFHRLSEYRNVREASPLSNWKPYAYIHALVCPEIKSEMWTWLMVNYRNQHVKSKYLIYKICGEICT